MLEAGENSSRDLPGRAVLAVLHNHAHFSELVAQTIGLLKIPGLACGISGRD
jgi:hypothetical protein